MKKGFFVIGLVVVVFLMPSVFASLSDFTFYTGDSVLLPGDEVNFTFVASLGGDCSVDSEQATALGGDVYSRVFDSLSSPNVSISCTDGDSDVITVPYRNVSGTSLFSNDGLMVGIDNVISLSSFVSRNETRSISDSDFLSPANSCTFDYEGDSQYFEESTSFVHAFSSSGNVSVLGECEFDFGNRSVTIEYTDIKAYEPQLSLVDSHAFENLSSSSGFNLGNYDFDLDGKDDIIVVGSFGMLIYSGDDYSVVWNSSEHSLSYDDVDFFISDLNWDGKGDMIVYSDSFVDVLTANSLSGDTWTFSKNDLVDSSNINYAGVFDIDGDFYKDVIVVNGSGNNWMYNYYDGQDLSLINSTSYSQEKFRCSYIRSFDYDKDGYEEIVCLDDDILSNNKLRFYDRNSTTTDLDSTSLTSYFTYDLGYNAGIEGIFFTDIDSDGDWDLGVLDGGNYSFYTIQSNDLTEISELIHLINGSIYDYYSSDIMNENFNNLISSKSKSSNYNLSLIYSNNSKEVSYFNDADIGLIAFSFDEDTDLELLSSDYISSTDKKLVLHQNNISSFRTVNHSYSANISIVDNSTNVTFSFENITSDWNYNNYFFKVEHSADNTVYRNDVFDSKQNLKYYQVKSDDSYEFDFSNRDLYTITFALNPYNMILAEEITVTKEAQGYDCLITQTTCIITTNSIENNIDVNASYVRLFSDGSKVTADFTDSTFTNLELLLTNTSDKFTNVTFTNVTINITESSFSSKYFLDSTFINSSIYISNTTVHFNDSIFTNTPISGSNYLLSNSSIVNFTSNGNSISLSGLINRTDGVEENFGLTSSLNRFWIYQNDSIVYNYTIIPETNFEYFANQTILSDFTQDYAITFNPTGLPYWNYSSNSSYQTDFRNYTLLENISNITGVKLSLTGLNMTLETYENLSGLNLSNKVNLTNQGFVFDLPGNWSINYSSALSSPIILKDGSNITLQNESNIFYGSGLTSGNYEFTERYNFSVDIPSNVLFNQSFNVSVVYTDKVTLTDFSNTCTITFDSVSGFFVNMNLTTLGNVVYNVSCSGIDYVEKIGTIYVSNSLFFDWSEEIGLFDVVDQSENILSDNQLFIIFDNFGFAYVRQINSTSDLFFNSFRNLSFSQDSIFYYSGNMHSDKKEVIN